MKRTFQKYASQEPALLDHKAHNIVHGHTHLHETIPLDHDAIAGNQIYFTSGTRHTYFGLARKAPAERKSIPFYKLHEHDDRSFEIESGAYA